MRPVVHRDEAWLKSASCVSSGGRESLLLVGKDASVDSVRDASFQAAASLFDGLVLGELASVVVPTGSGIAGLGDGNDMDGGVELAVASPG